MPSKYLKGWLTVTGEVLCPRALSAVISGEGDLCTAEPASSAPSLWAAPQWEEHGPCLSPPPPRGRLRRAGGGTRHVAPAFCWFSALRHCPLPGSELPAMAAAVSLASGPPCWLAGRRSQGVEPSRRCTCLSQRKEEGCHRFGNWRPGPGPGRAAGITPHILPTVSVQCQGTVGQGLRTWVEGLTQEVCIQPNFVT